MRGEGGYLCVFVHAQASTLSSALKFASVGACVGVVRGVFRLFFSVLMKVYSSILEGGLCMCTVHKLWSHVMHIWSACHACERVLSHVQAAHVFSVARKPAAEGLSSPCSSSGFFVLWFL